MASDPFASLPSSSSSSSSSFPSLPPSSPSASSSSNAWPHLSAEHHLISDSPISPSASSTSALFSTSSSTSSLASSTPSTATSSSFYTASISSQPPTALAATTTTTQSDSHRSTLCRPIPTPLALQTSNKSLRAHFLPRTSSLSALPNIAAITNSVPSNSTTTTTNSRRTQSLADSRSPSPAPSVVSHSSEPAGVAKPPTLAPIRRKPLANTASPLATQDPTSSHDLDVEDVYYDRLPTPDQRFTRSCSVDSPTLYEFPDKLPQSHHHEAPTLTPVVYPVSDRSSQIDRESWSETQKEAQEPQEPRETESSSQVHVPHDTPQPTIAVSVSRSSIIDNTPVALQTDSIATSSHHVPELTSHDPKPESEQEIHFDDSFVYDYSDTDSEDAQSEIEHLQLHTPPEEPEQLEEEPAESEQQSLSHRESQGSLLQKEPSTMPLFARKPSPPHLSLGQPPQAIDDDPKRPISPADDHDSVYSAYQNASPIAIVTSSDTPQSANTITTATQDANNVNKPLPKSPVSAKLGSFFGWSSASPSTTEFSDTGFSPLPSPLPIQVPEDEPHASSSSTENISHYNHNSNNTQIPQDTDNTHNHTNTRSINGASNLFQKNNNYNNTAGDNPLGYLETLQTPPVLATPTPASPLPLPTSVQLDEMEDELKAISAELASSIRREMDLEDLVDRLQGELSNPPGAPGKRSSDYFSDSGYSSAKYSDYDAAKEEIAQVQRRSEQEKAQIRLELTEKLSDERSRRKMLDLQIKELSERAANVDLAAMQRNKDDADAASDRLKQLEATCEDLRRRLAEERGVKENFEDLLSAMKSELQNTANERDNLRDEIVPQLRARVEGLESQATEHTRQTYDTTKMQQELQTLKEENSTLRTAAVAAAAAEAMSLHQHHQAPPSGLARSNTVKGQATTESREALSERLKDVEAQRDALHSALKSLLERQEFQNRENEKKIKVLETERERLLTASPKRAGFERDVAGLREEVRILRRRAEEALEQKWQVEKGLSSMKMDLDHAEEEIAHLRQLLQQNNILAPSTNGSRNVSGASSLFHEGAESSSSKEPVSSASLESTYQKLQQSYSEALDRIRSLELSTSPVSSDEKTTLALQRLEQALSTSIADRDAARQEVADQKRQLSDATAAAQTQLESERSLASELEASARRVEELALEVRTQLATNATLRERLANMVARGEQDQRANKERITNLEARLRMLEEQLVTAQDTAEERVARHEEKVAALKEAHNSQLQRLRESTISARRSLSALSTSSPPPPLLSPRRIPRSPMSPAFSANGKLMPPPANGPASPRPGSRGSRGSRGSNRGDADVPEAVEEDERSQILSLRLRIGDLEAALASADAEMQEVVGRMSAAQISVLQLQEEREEAVRETRRLQRQLEAEQVKNFEDRFRQLQSV